MASPKDPSGEACWVPRPRDLRGRSWPDAPNVGPEAARRAGCSVDRGVGGPRRRCRRGGGDTGLRREKKKRKMKLVTDKNKQAVWAYDLRVRERLIGAGLLDPKTVERYLAEPPTSMRTPRTSRSISPPSETEACREAAPRRARARSSRRRRTCRPWTSRPSWWASSARRTCTSATRPTPRVNPSGI